MTVPIVVTIITVIIIDLIICWVATAEWGRYKCRENTLKITMEDKNSVATVFSDIFYFLLTENVVFFLIGGKIKKFSKKIAIIGCFY